MRSCGPRRFAAAEIDDAVAEAVFQHRKRRLILGGGRWVFAALVVEDGVRPAFGDWTALSDASLRTLLACPELPPDLRQQIYLLNILRNWMGEIVAVDVYAKEDYRPLFRHWLVPRAASATQALVIQGTALPRWCDGTGFGDCELVSIENKNLEFPGKSAWFLRAHGHEFVAFDA